MNSTPKRRRIITISEKMTKVTKATPLRASYSRSTIWRKREKTEVMRYKEAVRVKYERIRTRVESMNSWTFPIIYSTRREHAAQKRKTVIFRERAGSQKSLLCFAILAKDTAKSLFHQYFPCVIAP